MQERTFLGLILTDVPSLYSLEILPDTKAKEISHRKNWCYSHNGLTLPTGKLGILLCVSPLLRTCGARVATLFLTSNFFNTTQFFRCFLRITPPIPCLQHPHRRKRRLIAGKKFRGNTHDRKTITPYTQTNPSRDNREERRGETGEKNKLFFRKCHYLLFLFRMEGFSFFFTGLGESKLTAPVYYTN